MAGPLPGGSPGNGSTVSADDAEQLRQDIERTRESLGETVEQLAAKVDVKSRARAKANEVAGRAQSARGTLTARTAVARRKAMAAGKSAPGMAAQVASKGVGTARKHPVPLAAGAAGAVAAVALTIWFLQWRKR